MERDAIGGRHVGAYRSLVLRFILALPLAAIASLANAQNPPYTCPVTLGCVEERESTHDIGRGVKLTLPDGWTYYAYPPPPLAITVGLPEVRAFRGKVIMAISSFPNLDGRIITEDWVREVTERAFARYVEASKEKAVHFVPASRGDLVGGYASFTAAVDGERPFVVLPNRRHASVTSFTAGNRSVVFTISIASEGPPDEDYAQAIQAVTQLESTRAAGKAGTGLISVPVPGESWSLTFESVPLKPMTLPFTPRGFAYAANAGRLNVSFYVEPPDCPGGEVNSVRYECFKAYKARSPFFVPGSLGGNEVPLGLQVVYATRGQFGGRTVNMLHIHVLFHRDGKEADFHVSIVAPESKDAADLLTLVESLRVVPK